LERSSLPDLTQGIYGFSLVSGIPPTPEATEQLIRRIAFIRETHYGGFWDFTADLKHGDLAYSDVLLQGHTDTTYFTDVSYSKHRRLNLG
jgi:trimethyllysine dioxygenase